MEYTLQVFLLGLMNIHLYKNWEMYSSYKNWKVYSRSCVQPNNPRLIVNNNGSYILYELKFCSEPIFFDKVRLIGEIYP